MDVARRNRLMGVTIFTIALVGMAAVIPHGVSAQGPCWSCQTGGGPGPQPNCVRVDEGLTDCQETYSDCIISGNFCQELVFLRFREDGGVYASLPAGDGVVATFIADAEATCEGVILHAQYTAIEERRIRAESRTLEL